MDSEFSFEMPNWGDSRLPNHKNYSNRYLNLLFKITDNPVLD